MEKSERKRRSRRHRATAEQLCESTQLRDRYNSAVAHRPIALTGGAGEVGQTLTQLLRHNAKLNTLALYDVAVNRSLPNYNFHDEEAFKPIPSGMLTITEKSYPDEGSHSNAAINTRQTDNNNHQENNGRSQIEKLVEALYRLPIAEEASALNNSLIPVEEIMPKAGNACGRMRPYTRILGEKDSSNVKIWQRGYATVAIRKCFSHLMYPSFREYYLNFAPEVKMSKKHRSIKETRKIRHSSCSALAAKENNRQSWPTSLLNRGQKPARRLMMKFGNVGVPPNVEAYCRAVEKLTDRIIPEVLSNNKLRLLHKIYSRAKFPSSLSNFVNHERENNREVVSFNCEGKTMTHDTLNVVEQENWIQQTCSKIKSILPDLHAKIRLHSTIALDSYCSENIFAVNHAISFSDIISNSAIHFASKDCEDDKPKIDIRKKIQEFCMQRKRTLKKNRDKNDICKKREKCETKRKCSKREQICERRRIDCSESRKRTDKRQDVVPCKERKRSCDKKSVRDCHKTRERKMKVQEEPCKQVKKDDISRVEEDPYRGQRPMKQEETLYKLHDTSPCRSEKKEEIKEKEEIKKPDCTEIKKVDPCEKKTCPTVKKAPECSDDKLQAKEEDLTARLRESGISERRERSSSPMKSAVEITDSGKPIDSNEIQINKDSLSIINSRRQFMEINFVKDFQQDLNSATDYKERSDFSFPREHFVTGLCRCSECGLDESKLSQDRQGNDDYFPQGDEYEEEIGIDDHQLGKKTPSKKSPRLEDEHDNVEATMLTLKNDKCINGGPLTRFNSYVHFSSIEELIVADRKMLLSKKVSNKDAAEKLQTLIEKEGGGPRALVETTATLLRKRSKILHDLIRKNQQAISGRVLRLGEPDCGEDSPGQPEGNPCEPPKGPCQPVVPPGHPSKPKPKRKPFCAAKKFEQVETSLKSLSRTSVVTPEECSSLKNRHNLRPIFGTGRLELYRCNCKFHSTDILDSELICTRDFSSFENKPRNIILRHKAFGWIHEQSRKQCLKRSLMAKSSSPPSYLSLETHSFIEKYFLPSLPCHHESISLLRFVLYPKPNEKPSFLKICSEKSLQSLQHSKSLKSSAPSSKYLLKRKLSSPELCKQYFSSRPLFYSSYPHLLSQDVTESIQRLPKSQRNNYPISLHRVHRRGFHSSLFPLAKSDSSKPSTCKTMDKICKPTEAKKTDESGQACKEKSDVCRQEKVKCDKSQQNKEKARQKPKKMDPACRKTCLPIGKCELPRTVPPPKMEYAKVTCSPPKFTKPKPCPPLPEHFEKDDRSHTEIKYNVRNKQVCAPSPLPKPPYPPIVLCPCPPPHKVHPGPCPCYEMKEIGKRPSVRPCQLKKKYPCPTSVHYCHLQKKPCNLNLKRETDCKRRKKEEAAS
ncbi:PREDICTED: uncharacterized protein LOC105565488 [Vollenhovia emeryi]|uniref:uncharacterized protein LOC105565488 n=1 Tax=Vollenhovia emeryi TaxID=411798 RepID=UPI0005F36933|nr:PREDICTED: uncharacterized protein LOC105565488 [Vollenhovia emeryi]